MTAGANAWDTVRTFALGLPAAEEDFPWGETVIKVRRKPGIPPWRKEGVHGPMFLWMGQRDADVPSVCVKLTRAYEEAVAVAAATPTTISGLGQWGWLTVRLREVDVALVSDWVEESYRNVAPKRFVAELDARSSTRQAGQPERSDPCRHIGDEKVEPRRRSRSSSASTSTASGQRPHPRTGEGLAED